MATNKRTQSEIAYWVNKIHCGNALEVLKQMPSEFVDTIITSCPYWGLRDYGEETKTEWEDGWYGQLGLEPTLEMYIEHLLQIMKELKRVLKKTGVIFWNHGDCYHSKPAGNKEYKYFQDGLYQRLGLRHTQGGKSGNTPKVLAGKPKCMALQNWRFILRCIDELGLILRNVIIWYKPNHLPSSVKDRLTNTYEPVFMLVKSKKYYFDLDAIRVPHTSKPDFSRKVKTKSSAFGIRWYGGQVRENHDIHTCYSETGKNPGDLWEIPTQPCPKEFRGAHFALFPEKLVEPMILAGCPKDGIVLDPFCGLGTTCVVAKKLGRNWIGIDISPKFCKLAQKRIEKTPTPLI